MGLLHTMLSLLTAGYEREIKNDSPKAVAWASKWSSSRNFWLYSRRQLRSYDEQMAGGSLWATKGWWAARVAG